MGVDNSFNLADFKKNFKIHIIECDDTKISFDLVGVDAPIANALRRILIAEVQLIIMVARMFTNS